MVNGHALTPLNNYILLIVQEQINEQQFICSDNRKFLHRKFYF